MPFMMTVVLSRPGEDRVGQYSALYSISFGLSVMIAPTVGLGLADKIGFHYMYLILGSFSALTAVGFYIISEKIKLKSQTDE